MTTPLPETNHPLVRLRELRRDDAPAWYAYLSRPDVYEHTSWNLRSIVDLDPLFDEIESGLPNAPRRYAIVARGGGEMVGHVGLPIVSAMHRNAEIAYDLAPSAWGHGIAPAACTAVTDWAFAALGFVRVQATVLASNERSARVLERCGFAREGFLRSYRLVRGTPGDYWMYARVSRP